MPRSDPPRAPSGKLQLEEVRSLASLHPSPPSRFGTDHFSLSCAPSRHRLAAASSARDSVLIVDIGKDAVLAGIDLCFPSVLGEPATPYYHQSVLTAFSPDGCELAACADHRKTVLVHALPIVHKPRAVLHLPYDMWNDNSSFPFFWSDLKWSPSSGRFIVALGTEVGGSRRTAVFVWSAQTYSFCRRISASDFYQGALESRLAQVTSVDFPPFGNDDRLLVSGPVELWKRRRYLGTVGGFSLVDLSSPRAVADVSQIVCTPAPPTNRKGKPRLVQARFCGDEKCIVVAARTQLFRFESKPTNHVPFLASPALTGHSGPITGLFRVTAAHPDGDVVVSLGPDSTLRCWKMNNSAADPKQHHQHALRKVDGVARNPPLAAVTPDGFVLLCRGHEVGRFAIV